MTKKSNDRLVELQVGRGRRHCSHGHVITVPYIQCELLLQQLQWSRAGREKLSKAVFLQS